MTEEMKKELVDALVKATDPVRIMIKGPFPPDWDMDNDYHILLVVKDVQDKNEARESAFWVLPSEVNAYIVVVNESEFRKGVEYKESLEENFVNNGETLYEKP